MSKRLFLVLILVAAGGLWAGHAVWQQKKYARAYETVAPHTTKTEVLRRFGRPTKVGACNLKPSWDAEPVEKDVKCVEAFSYFSWVSPEQWVIGFDQDGKAVAKYHLVSP